MTTTLEPATAEPAATIEPAVLGVIVELDASAVAQHPDNLRTDIDPNSLDMRALTASVAEVGILVPLIVVPVDQVAGDREWDPAVTHVAVDGNRRQAAARAAGLPLPCVVSPDVAAARDTVRTMLVTGLTGQRLTQAEELRGIQHALDLGLSPTKLGKALGRSRKEVQTASKAAALAGNVAERAASYPLTLDQLAELVEWEHDPVAVDELIRSAGCGTWEHTVAHLRSERESAALIESVLGPRRAELETAGIAVVDHATWNQDLTRWCDPADADRAPLTEATHRPCPGHAVHLEADIYSVDDDEQEAETDSYDDDSYDDGAYDDEVEEPGDHGEVGDHQGEDGAAAADEDRPATPVYLLDGDRVIVRVVETVVCTDPQGYGHVARWGRRDVSAAAPAAPRADDETDDDYAARVEAARAAAAQQAAQQAAERAAAAYEQGKAEMRELKRLNKLALSAEGVRRRFLRQQMTATKHHKQMTAWAINQIIRRESPHRSWDGGRSWSGDHGVLGGILGDLAELDPHSVRWATPTLEVGRGKPVPGVTPRVEYTGQLSHTATADAMPSARHGVLLWAHVAAAYEDAMLKDFHRQHDPARADYLRHLVDLGYTLAEPEQVAIDRITPRQPDTAELDAAAEVIGEPSPADHQVDPA